MASSPSVDDLAVALAVTEQLIATISDRQWDEPTPCAEWDLRALVNHLVGGNHLFAAILAARTTVEEARRTPPADLLAEQPVAAYRASADAVLASFRHPGALDSVVTVPFGTVPGIVALHLRITEVLVHGWDIAQATGQRPTFPEALVEQELAFSQQAITAIPPGRTPFAPPVPVAGDAPAIDRLAACLGRRPAGHWRTPDAP